MIITDPMTFATRSTAKNNINLNIYFNIAKTYSFSLKLDAVVGQMIKKSVRLRYLLGS